MSRTGRGGRGRSLSTTAPFKDSPTSPDSEYRYTKEPSHPPTYPRTLGVLGVVPGGTGTYHLFLLILLVVLLDANLPGVPRLVLRPVGTGVPCHRDS